MAILKDKKTLPYDGEYLKINVYDKPRRCTLALSCNEEEALLIREFAKGCELSVSDTLRMLIVEGWEAKGFDAPCPLGPTWLEAWEEKFGDE